MPTSAGRRSAGHPWLLVSGDFTPHGGMDRANLALATHLANRSGVELHIVTHRAAPEVAALGAGAAGAPHLHLAPRPFGSHLLGEPFLARLGLSWARQVGGSGGHVVVNGGNCPWDDVSWVHYVHAAYAPQNRTTLVRRAKDRFRRGRDLRAERRNLTGARLAICNSRRTQRDLVERVAVPAARTRVIYYGIDAARFSLVPADAARSARVELGWPDDRPHILFIGALGDRRKGFDTLHRAWTELCGRPDWDGHLVVAGAGAELPLWRRRFVEDGLESRVTFLGFRTDIDRVLAASDVLVHPARYEAYGLGVHEALCRGVPAIVSASAGVAERYPPVLSDLLVPDPDDVGQLADRLRAWRRQQDRIRADLLPFADQLRGRSWDDMAADIVSAVEAT